jgi:hypothetical protein
MHKKYISQPQRAYCDNMQKSSKSAPKVLSSLRRKEKIDNSLTSKYNLRNNPEGLKAIKMAASLLANESVRMAEDCQKMITERYSNAQPQSIEELRERTLHGKAANFYAKAIALYEISGEYKKLTDLSNEAKAHLILAGSANESNSESKLKRLIFFYTGYSDHRGGRLDGEIRERIRKEKETRIDQAERAYL